jgi:hypothetical protein
VKRAAGALAALFTEQFGSVREIQKVHRTPCSATPVNARVINPSCLKKDCCGP